MDKIQIYDWLLEQGIEEPAVLQLGDKCILGRWVSTAHTAPSKAKADSRKANGYGRTMVLSGPKAIEVLAEASSWEEAIEALKRR